MFKSFGIGTFVVIISGNKVVYSVQMRNYRGIHSGEINLLAELFELTGSSGLVAFILPSIRTYVHIQSINRLPPLRS